MHAWIYASKGFVSYLKDYVSISSKEPHDELLKFSDNFDAILAKFKP